MRRHGIRCSTSVAVAAAVTLAFSAPRAAAQTVGRPQPTPPKEETGTVRGVVAWVRTLGGQGKTQATLALSLARGVQYSGKITDETEFTVQNLTITDNKARALVTKGVPVEANWRTSDEQDGRVFTAIRVQTVEIVGTIKSIRNRRLVAIAKPKDPPEEPPPITVQGRRPPATRPPPPPAKPKQIKLGLDKDITEVRLNGKPAKTKDLKRGMRFEGVVINGGPSTLLRILTGSDRKPSSEKEEGGDRKTKRPGDR